MNTSEDFVRSGFGGPYSVDELRQRYPQLGDVALGIRAKAAADPLYLGAEVLGRTLLRTPSSAHREVAAAMTRQENILYVDHRGTLKTTLLDEIGSIWQLVNWPDDRILFLQSNVPNGSKESRKVRDHFIRNQKFRLLFPEYAMDPGLDEGNILTWSVPCRRAITAEGSFNVSTPGASTTGLHFEVIKASDLMNPTTVPPPCGTATADEMMKVKQWYATTDGLIVTKRICPRAHRTIDSNRWHDADHAGDLLRADPKQPEEGGIFRKIIRGVRRDDDGKFIAPWPEVIPSEELHEIRARPTMTAALWAANYCSDPMPEGGMSFQRDWFRVFKRAPSDLDVAITCDPAFTEASARGAYKRDRSGLIVSGVSRSDKQLYLLDYRAGRWTPHETVEQIFALAGLWEPKWVGIEETNGSKGLIAIFLSEMQRTGRMVPYRKIKMPGSLNKTSSKDARMGPLHAHAEHFGIYVPGAGKCEEVIEELLRFGVADHDDLADALAMRAMDLYATWTSPKKAEEPTLTYVPGRRAQSGAEAIARINRRQRNRMLPPWKRPMGVVG